MHLDVCVRGGCQTFAPLTLVQFLCLDQHFLQDESLLLGVWPGWMNSNNISGVADFIFVVCHNLLAPLDASIVLGDESVIKSHHVQSVSWCSPSTNVHKLPASPFPNNAATHRKSTRLNSSQ